MHYTLNQLQIFLKIAQLKSITKAAEALHLTQPAVSIQLKNFQNQFDIALTEVVGRQLYITDFGEEIATAAETILNEVHKINYRTLAYKGEMAGRLKISVVSTGKYVMPYFLTDFMKENPGVELAMDVTNKTEVIRSLEGNEVDFSLVSIIPDNFPVEKVDLLENRLFLVSNIDGDIRITDSMAKNLQDYPLIYREPGSGTRQAMEQFFKKHDVKAQKKMELTSNEAVKQAVIAGLGYSVMPIIGIKNEIRSRQMRIISADGLPIKTMWQLIWLKGKKLSPVAQAYLQYVDENKERIIKEYFKDI